ncbi:MAG: phosphatase PAP2 family protein [Bacteroidales bacterium]|nr:phosphatase PAP2 family protein [Bacteroidales bacterium]
MMERAARVASGCHPGDRKVLMLWVFIAALLAPGRLISQEIHFQGYLGSYVTDASHIAASPFTWDAGDWGMTAGLAGAAVVIMAFDKEILDFFERNRTPDTENISRYFAEPFGSGLYTLPLLGILYGAGTARKEPRMKVAALTGLKAFLFSGGVAWVGKQIFQRQRPGQGDPADPWIWIGPLPPSSPYDAFPSGHAASAWGVATVISRAWPEKKWVTLASCGVAILTSLSRIHDQKHWASDVFAGAVLGAYIGSHLAGLNLLSGHITLSPWNGMNGLTLSFQME